MSVKDQALADFLEKTADYIDALEAENRRLAEGQQTIHENRVSEDARKLASQYANATGEELDPTLARKIAAHSDEDVRQVLHKLAATDEADGLGRSKKSRTKAAGTGDDAWDRFGGFLAS